MRSTIAHELGRALHRQLARPRQVDAHDLAPENPNYVQGHHSNTVVNYAPNVGRRKLHPTGQGVEDYDTHYAMARNSIGLCTWSSSRRYLRALPPPRPGSTIILLDGSGFSIDVGRARPARRPSRTASKQVQLFEWKEEPSWLPPLQVVPPAFQQRQDAGTLREAGRMEQRPVPVHHEP